MSILSNQPPADIDVNELSKDLNQAVQQVREIQRLVNSFINEIVVRKNDETEKETLAIKATITQVRVIRVELDKLGSKYSKLRLNGIHPVPLGNTGYVSLDATEERSGFYKQLLECYTWLKNVDEDATRALQLLQSSHGRQTNLSAKGDCQSLLEIVNELKNGFPDMTFDDSLLTSEGVLVLRIGKVFVVDLCFSGLVISHIIVKSMIESFTLKYWEPSKHGAFKKLSDILTCKILSIKYNTPKELLKEVLLYVISYKTIFQVKCSVCGKHLSGQSGITSFLPPLMKDPNGNFYHLTCK